MTAAAGQPPALGIPSRLTLGAMVVLLATAALAWAGAALAALATGGALPETTLEDAALALPRLGNHLGDPAAAWPPEVAALLPGPLGYWAAQLFVLAVAGTVALGALRLWRRLSQHLAHPLGVRPDAGLAARRDLSALVVKAPTPGRVTLGTAGRRLLAAEPQASLAVVGPTGCGKTAGLAIPALLEWSGPVLATSVKADLIGATIEHRRARGKVWVYDPAGVSGQPGAQWSPLDACGTWPGALQVAAWLTDAAAPSRDGASDSDYWYAQARKALAPHLHAAALTGRTMGDVVRWIDAQESDDVAEALGDGEDAVPCDALLAANALWQKEARLRGSVYATMENVVAGYAHADRSDDGGGRIDLEAWLAGDHSIYIVATAHEQARLRPVLTVLVQQALRTAYDRAARNGGTLEHPALVLLDEAGNIAPLADLPGYAATARSHGITLVTVWQDLAQIEAIYRHRAQTVLNNHRAKLFASGIADVATLDYLSRLVGEHRQTERNVTTDLTADRRSLGEHITYRRLAPADLLRRLPAGDAVLLYGNQAPAQVRLRPWYKLSSFPIRRTPSPRARPVGPGGR
jgi:type IV secretion system protein VirD4